MRVKTKTPRSEECGKGGNGCLPVYKLLFTQLLQTLARFGETTSVFVLILLGKCQSHGLERLQTFPRWAIFLFIKYSKVLNSVRVEQNTHTHAHTRAHDTQSHNNPLWIRCNTGLNIQENTWIILTYLTGVLLTINYLMFVEHFADVKCLYKC